MNTRKKKSSFSRASLQSRPSVGASASKLPRSTPLMHSSRKVMPSTSKSLSKRTSYFGSSDHHVMKDSRPVSDKSYMRKCINDLIAFLNDAGYPFPLTFKMMNPPTNKEYFRIVEFVYRILSTGYKMMARPEEETAKIFSDLCYPFNISKSTLNNIGALSAWPNALGALDWLVDLVKYQQECENSWADVIYKDNKKLQHKHEYLQATYTAFMHGENEPFSEINDALTAQIDAINVDIIKSNNELSATIEKDEAEGKSLMEKKESILKAEQELSRLTTVTRNLEDYFVQLDKYCLSIEEKRESVESQSREVETSIRGLEKEIKEIQCTVTGQELSVGDVQNMEKETSEIESKIKALQERIKQLQGQYHDKQNLQSKMLNQIKGQVSEYTDACEKLKALLATDSGKLQESDFALVVELSDIEKSKDKLLTVVLPSSIEMKSALLKESGKIQKERNSNRNQCEQLKEEVADRKRATENLQKRLDALKQEEEQKIEEYKNLEERERMEIEKDKEDIQRLKNINSLSVDDITMLLERKRKEFKECEARIEKEADRCENELTRLCKACDEYREKTEKLVQDFNKDVTASLEKYVPMIRKTQSELQGQRQLLQQKDDELTELYESVQTAPR